MRLVLLLFLSVVLAAVSAQCPHTQQGLTSTSTLSEWSTQDAQITVAEGQQILLNQSPGKKLKSITINGELIFNDAAINLDVDWIRVNPTGKLTMGSKTCALKNKIIVTFFGDRSINGTNALGKDPMGGDFLGDKGLAVVSGAKIQVYGNVAGITSWTRLATTAAIGSTTIKVSGATGWKKGDRIVIASTDYHQMIGWPYPGLASNLDYLRGNRNFLDQNEDRTLVEDAAADGTIKLDLPLNFTHFGEGYQRAEVGLLTRNIVFRGDPTTASQKFGGHIIIRNVTQGEIVGVELYYMGQQGVMGRYPVHWHFMGDKVGQGMFIRQSSIHDTFQRCVAIHDTNGVSVIDNVAYNVEAHCYFLEDGGERYNVFNRNLGVRIIGVPEASGRQIIPTDDEPSVFWITNPNNEFVDNAAVGGKFGYWFIMPVHPTGQSATRYPNPDLTVRPRWTPLGKFDNNVAHSNSDTGLEIDNMLKADGTTELASYQPYNPPYPAGIQNYQLTSTDAVFKNFISYKNREYGVWTRGGPIRFDNLVSMDNLHGINCVPGPSMVENSLIVGESNNVGTPKYFETGLDRSRPGRWGVNTHIKGFETYDNGGPQYLRNITFVNFVSTPQRPAGALGGLTNAPFMHDTRNRYTNLRFENANRVWLLAPGVADSNAQAAWLDIDGSITDVKPGAWIISNITFNARPECTPRPEWNAYVCPPNPEGYAQLVITNNDPSGSTDYGGSTDLANLNNRVIRAIFSSFRDSNGKSRSIDTYGSSVSGTKFQFMTNLIARQGYAVRFVNNLPTPKDITIALDSSLNQDWIILAIPYASSAQPFQVTSSIWGGTATDMKSVSSIAELGRGTYYYDSNSQYLYLRLMNTAGTTGYSERWGFNDYSYDGYTVRVVASCHTCATTNQAIPSASLLNPINTDLEYYKADLNACQQRSPQSNSKAVGTGYFIFEQSTRKLEIAIYHELTATVTDVFIGQGAFGTNGRLLAAPKFSDYSPIRTVVTLSRPEWESLVKGELYVTIATKNYPQGEIRGHILCNNPAGCSVPPQVPIIDSKVCSLDQDGYSIYTESLPGWPRWDMWVWTSDGDKAAGLATYANATFPGKQLCGNYTMRMGMRQGNNKFAHHTNGANIPNPTVDTSVLKYLQFYIKVEDGYGFLPLRLRLEDSTGAALITGFVVEAKYINDYKIDDTRWTRVRIPFADMKLTGVVNVQRIEFSLYDNTQYKYFYLDNVMFVTGNVPQGALTMTPAITSNNVQKYDVDFCLKKTGQKDPTDPNPPPPPQGSGNNPVPQGSTGTGTDNKTNSSTILRTSVAAMIISLAWAGLLLVL